MDDYYFNPDYPITSRILNPEDMTNNRICHIVASTDGRYHSLFNLHISNSHDHRVDHRFVKILSVLAWYLLARSKYFPIILRPLLPQLCNVSNEMLMF